MRAVNVDRMRKYNRRGRRRNRLESWGVLIQATGPGIIWGPFPGGPGEAVPLRAEQAEQLRWEQARLGITVDGILGVQTWGALAQDNGYRLDPQDVYGHRLPLRPR